MDIDLAPSTMVPASVSPLGNYAAQIQWQDGFNQVGSAHAQAARLPSMRAAGSDITAAAQVATFELLQSLPEAEEEDGSSWQGFQQ